MELQGWQDRALDAPQVIEPVKSGDHVFIHGASATPHLLIDALCNRRDIEEVTTYHLHLSGEIGLGCSDTSHILPVSLFTGSNLRTAVKEGRAEHVPIFLSDIPALFSSRSVPLDVAIVQLSPPDRHGFCSLGTSVDAARAAVDSARIVVAEINMQMPRTHGNTAIHLSQIARYTVTNRPLVEHRPSTLSPVELRIGEIVAELIEDGSTIQVGIGGIPDAVLGNLQNKRDLGVHTEMFSDRMVDLFESGAITNKKKQVHAGRVVTSFVTGTKKVFDFVHDNPVVEFYGCDRTNDTSLIRKNPRVVAINSALQIDLTGQVAADSIGRTIYSGIGGQMDFIRGAALSVGGQPIIAIPSTASNGTVSRICPVLLEGGGVVTSRGHVHWVVTEYGAVNLHGKSIRQRADLLTSIAHPDFRAELKREFAAGHVSA